MLRTLRRNVPGGKRRAAGWRTRPVDRDREELWLGLVLGFAAGVVASLVSIPVMLGLREGIVP